MFLRTAPPACHAISVVATLHGKVEPNELGLFVPLGVSSNPVKQFASVRGNP